MLRMLRSARGGERDFFATFHEVSGRITAAARLLRDGLREPDRFADAAEGIATLEHEADRIVHDLSVRLDRMMFAPVDLEDVPVLASRLDAVIDRIDEAARWVLTARITESRVIGAWEPAVQLAEVVVQATEAIEDAVAASRDRVLVLARCVDVRELEEVGDDVYSDAITLLFDGRPAPLDALKWKQLYDELEDALDDCKTVANVIEGLVLGAA
ncbi:MAG: DUF47 domain-containing protein [Gemmatimonadaceae bacterium]